MLNEHDEIRPSARLSNDEKCSPREPVPNDDLFWAQHDPVVEQCYAGEWVVPWQRQIVSHGTDVNTVLDEAVRVTRRNRDELVACAIPRPHDWLVDA